MYICKTLVKHDRLKLELLPPPPPLPRLLNLPQAVVFRSTIVHAFTNNLLWCLNVNSMLRITKKKMSECADFCQIYESNYS